MYNLGIARDRKFGMGYGTLSNSPEAHRKLNSSFPYPDEFEELEYTDEEEELADKIANKMILPQIKSDPLERADTSSFADPYYVKEVAKGISPFPAMYKNRDGHLGYSVGPTSSYHAHGFKMSRPVGQNFDTEAMEDDSEEYIYNLEEEILLELRKFIKLLLLEVL